MRMIESFVAHSEHGWIRRRHRKEKWHIRTEQERPGNDKKVHEGTEGNTFLVSHLG